MTSAEYSYIQEACNLRKLWAIHVPPLLIPYISYIVRQHLFALDPSREAHALKGLTHGSRNGFEAYALAKLLNCSVTGTDISETAEFFPSLKKHDFHYPLRDGDNKNMKFDFIYTNSYDHAHSPIACLKAMHENLNETGIIIIDMHESSSSTESTTTDPHVFTIETVRNYIDKLNTEDDCQLFLTAIHSINTVSSRPLHGRNKAEINKLIGMGIEIESIDKDLLRFKENSNFLVISKKTPRNNRAINEFVEFSLKSPSFMEDICKRNYTIDSLANDLLQCCFSSISIAQSVQSLFLEQAPFNWKQSFDSDDSFYKKYADHCALKKGSLIKELKLFT